MIVLETEAKVVVYVDDEATVVDLVDEVVVVGMVDVAVVSVDGTLLLDVVVKDAVAVVAPKVVDVVNVPCIAPPCPCTFESKFIKFNLNL